MWMAGHGVWRSLVARFVRDEEAAGSNPVTPTGIPAGQRPYPIQGGAFGLPRTATKYRNGAHLRDSPSLRIASLVAVEPGVRIDLIDTSA
jgi:hypothetical protein